MERAEYPVDVVDLVDLREQHAAAKLRARRVALPIVFIGMIVGDVLAEMRLDRDDQSGIARVDTFAQPDQQFVEAILSSDRDDHTGLRRGVDQLRNAIGRHRCRLLKINMLAGENGAPRIVEMERCGIADDHSADPGVSQDRIEVMDDRDRGPVDLQTAAPAMLADSDDVAHAQRKQIADVAPPDRTRADDSRFHVLASNPIRREAASAAASENSSSMSQAMRWSTI